MIFCEDVGRGLSTEVLATLIVRLAYVFTKAKVTNGYSHRLRDTFAISSLEAGVSLDSVSILLGHKSIKITERHLKSTAGTICEQMSVGSAYLDGLFLLAICWRRGWESN